MLVKQNSIFCAIYIMLTPLHIAQIGWFNCHVSKCLSMDDCTTEAYSTPTWPGTQKLGIGPTLLLSWRNYLNRKKYFFLITFSSSFYFWHLMSSHSPVRFDAWENVIKPFTAVTNDLSLDNLQWTVHCPKWWKFW